MIRATGDSKELLARAIERLDNVTHALELPMPDTFHIGQMKAILPEVVSDLKKWYAEVVGENPWADEPRLRELVKEAIAAVPVCFHVQGRTTCGFPENHRVHTVKGCQGYHEFFGVSPTVERVMGKFETALKARAHVQCCNCGTFGIPGVCGNCGKINSPAFAQELEASTGAGADAQRSYERDFEKP